MEPAVASFLDEWHKMVAAQNPELISHRILDSATISSPMFWKPKGPKPYVMTILKAVTEAFEDFRYTKEWIDGREMILEFEAHVGDVHLKGIDRITLDANGNMTHLEVLIRPFNALQALAQHVMAAFAKQPAA